jgi:hypothetical protein
MTRVLIIRLILSVIIAFLIGRFFFQKASTLKTAGLAAALLGLAYLFEHIRKRNKG